MGIEVEAEYIYGIIFNFVCLTWCAFGLCVCVCVCYCFFAFAFEAGRFCLWDLLLLSLRFVFVV